MSLKEKMRRWTLFLGVLQLTFGCLVGFIPPTAVPWFRGIVMAHIEFTVNGILVITLGLLLSELQLGTPALWTWFATVQIGTWTNGAAGLVGAFIGYSSKLMTTINEKFPAPNGLDDPRRPFSEVQTSRSAQSPAILKKSAESLDFRRTGPVEAAFQDV